MKNIIKIELTRDQFNQNVAYIKANYPTDDGYVYPTDNKHNAGYIVQSNNFTLTDADGNITMFYIR